MATRSETIDLTQSDLQEAIKDWLYKKYSKSPEHGEWSIQLKVAKVARGLGMSEYDTDHFSATAIRKA